jgi:squalene-associated FAD-dependent desaturase
LKTTRKIAVIGAGWAGLAAAITATQQGHQVSLLEASRHWGGRARALPPVQTDAPTLDNGQHILIGAYQQTLKLMQTVGVDIEQALWRMPLKLQDLNGNGLSLPNLPFPLNLLWGIANAKGWHFTDKYSLLTTAWRWQRMNFECSEALSVRDVCQGLSPAIWRDLIEPLCVSALNTPAHEASGAVFLRVLKDAVFGPPGSADLLLPRQDLGQVFPHAAVRWLEAHHAKCQLGARVDMLSIDKTGTGRWQILDEVFDHVVLATPAWDAAHLMTTLNPAWSQTASALTHEAIATVYIQMPHDFKLPQPMLSLPSSKEAPAQFVFDRGQMMVQGNTPGLLAFVVSAAEDDKQTLEAKVMQQALGLLKVMQPGPDKLSAMQVLQTVIEKRATFACTPHLERPGAHPVHGLTVCGDYVAGPYPATLEGAVLSGIAAGQHAAQLLTA